MKRKSFLLKLVTLTTVFICCYAFKPAPIKAFVARAADSVVITDSAQATKTITGFLRWYKLNYKKANAFSWLIKDGNGNYKVSARACTGYLNFVQSSRLVSPKYIGYWQTFFNDKAIQLRKEKIQSDIPEGFDMDFILMTQEPELVLNKIAQLKFNVISINSTKATIGATLPADSTIQYQFEMNKSKAGWQIDYIATSNYD